MSSCLYGTQPLAVWHYAAQGYVCRWKGAPGHLFRGCFPSVFSLGSEPIRDPYDYGYGACPSPPRANSPRCMGKRRPDEPLETVSVWATARLELKEGQTWFIGRFQLTHGTPQVRKHGLEFCYVASFHHLIHDHLRAAHNGPCRPHSVQPNPPVPLSSR
jgi:hypothetical protein